MFNYKFTNTWFKGSNLESLLVYFVDPNAVNRVLEIGSYEGASACFFSDKILDNTDSILICVDPFLLDDQTTPLTNSTRDFFHHNIRESKNSEKITVVEQYSKKFFEQNYFTFNFIYIDGSHLLDDVTLDLENSLKFIAPNGIIWMDDYAGGDGSIKEHINMLHKKYSDRLELIHKGYQIAFRVN